MAYFNKGFVLKENLEGIQLNLIIFQMGKLKLRQKG